MKIIFTKGDNIASQTIRSLTKEPVSHVALDFGSFIVHSNFRGVHVTWHTFFKNSSEIVYSLEPLKQSDHKTKLDKTLGKHEFSWYDFGAFIFLGVSLFLRKYLKIPLPKSNLWQSTGMFMCTEWVMDFIEEEADSMITPYKLYTKLLQTGDWLETTSKND